LKTCCSRRELQEGSRCSHGFPWSAVNSPNRRNSTRPPSHQRPCSRCPSRK
jgi:hypothetical protein